MVDWRANSANPRVLVTGGDYPGPLAAIRALRVAGYEPWVASTSRTSYGARSRATHRHLVLPDSRSDPEGFIEGVIRAHDMAGFIAILGGTERDLLALAEQRERFGSLAASLPELESFRRATSKPAINELACKVGLRVPRTVPLDRLDSDEPPHLPVVVKPFRSEDELPQGGYLHQEVRRVDTYAELRSIASEFSGKERWFAQEFISGQLGAICGVASNGKILCAVHQRSERIWPQELGISAYATTVARDEDLEADLACLLDLLGWSGIFQAQFIYGDFGTYLIDLNPRIYGSLALAIKSGLNLPAIWVSVAAGMPVDVADYRCGVHYRYEELDVHALVHLVAGHNFRAFLRELLPRRQTAHAIACLSDPFPMFTSFAKLRTQNSWRSLHHALVPRDVLPQRSVK